MISTAPSLPDFELQDALLARVSRTFALTIPALSKHLEQVVGNAYLLCRITDTIEDAATLDPEQSQEFCERFIQVVEGREDPRAFATALQPYLEDNHTTDDERWLVRETPAVINITWHFSAEERSALSDCVRIMGRGMAVFQHNESLAGLSDLAEHGRYCYVVAGVVGEMLTRLFIVNLPQLGSHRESLMELAVSFGQGLQMTNILKDTWEDRSRGACWLPRDVFAEEGIDLAEIRPGMKDRAFVRAWERLIGLAHGHLENALAYTLKIPSEEVGIRNFCLWALFMALLNLRKLRRHPDFTNGNMVKIRRSTVHSVVLYCRWAARSDRALRYAFKLCSMGLPGPRPGDLTPPTGLQGLDSPGRRSNPMEVTQ